MPQSRCVEPMGEACSLLRRLGLSVLRRPAHGQRKLQPSSCQLGHKLDAIILWQARGRPSPSSIVGGTLRESLQRIACSPWPPGQSAQFQPGLTQNAKCLKSPHASVVPQGFQFSRFRPSCFRVPVLPLLSRFRLTAPSRGRPASGPPLTSNVRAH
jgi:hypothetical protein